MQPGETAHGPWATADEVREAIEALTDEDSFRLIKAARAFIGGTEYESPEDLLNEAVVRALDGARHWPSQRVDFVRFMAMAMKSIADGSRQSPLQARTEHLEAMAQEGAAADTVLDGLGHATPGVEQQLLEQEELEHRQALADADADSIDAYFANDEEVAWLILCLKEGELPSKARELAGLTTTQYETARKRLRRGAEKLFGDRSKR